MTGATVEVHDRMIMTSTGEVVGKAAQTTRLGDSKPIAAKVTGIMVRTRQQTPAAYLEMAKVDSWEVVLVELIHES